MGGREGRYGEVCTGDLDVNLHVCRMDPITGGPSEPHESVLDQMTEEEKEEEARKLQELFHRLDA